MAAGEVYGGIGGIRFRWTTDALPTRADPAGISIRFRAVIRLGCLRD